MLKQKWRACSAEVRSDAASGKDLLRLESTYVMGLCVVLLTALFLTRQKIIISLSFHQLMHASVIYLFTLDDLLRHRRNYRNHAQFIFTRRLLKLFGIH
jgi:hypothetical protein